ncbi:HlyD family type I secretion periplasmic adaptor subunit [Aliiroseovarius sp. F47248L]|uniref:HlyD family type I secretion periplasmic adaptor subunit n=1 Tax=Aliiroseovarius sp. F47248L TaxID=2926420 RepID=UPI001FF542E5|nr:HlyD family type I secretion periplasmic adaptor subunit [Aliiroseovarius sp. F47248L]MCK0139383.1 HlyD family type I secretion periplasmic adaptor subunit [Aliiroseovarius sp. F47248L]
MTNEANAIVVQEWHDKVPRSISKLVTFGLLLLVITFGGFGAWAFRAPLAAAVIAQGSFVATGRNKIVQHLEGGIIHEILVSEGDMIQAGDTLLTLDETAALANRRELQIRKSRLEATVARLAAEYGELDELEFSEELTRNAREDFEIASILDGQRLSFNVARSSLNNDLALLERNINALQIRMNGYQIQHDSHLEMIELLDQEHADKSKLLAGGLIRQSEVNALLRAKVEAQGQVGRLQAEVHENEQLMLKHKTQIEKVRSLYRETALDELQVIQAELESVREKYRKAENVLTRSEVVAPVSGTVVRLHYFTPGGVIETGKPIAEILPSSAPLIVETLILRTDVDSVHLGQDAVVRLTGLNARTTPVLDGTVEYVSADAISDTANGVTREVFVARVSLSPEELNRVADFIPTPGMPAEVMIQTDERTFAQYIARPLVDSMTRAFKEQ